LLGGDPIDWEHVLKRLPSLVRFLDWIGDGGHPESLSPTLRKDLMRTNAYFEENRLPRPLAPYLQVPVSTPIRLPVRIKKEVHHYLPDLSLPVTCSGWEAIAWQELDACLLGLDAKQADLNGRRTTLPPEIREAHLLTGTLTAPSVGKTVKGSFGMASSRPAVSRWILPETTHLQAAIYATTRCFDARTPVAARLATVLLRLLRDPFSWAFHTHLLPLPNRWLLGGHGHASLSARLLGFQLAFKKSQSWSALTGFSPRSHSQEKVAHNLLLQGLRAPIPEDPIEISLWTQLQVERTTNILIAKDFQGVSEIYQKILPSLASTTSEAQSPWRTIQGFMAVAMLRSQSPLGLPRKAVEDILRVLRNPSTRLLRGIVHKDSSHHGERYHQVRSQIQDPQVLLDQMEKIARQANPLPVSFQKNPLH
jgi:hypothetical protein